MSHNYQTDRKGQMMINVIIAVTILAIASYALSLMLSAGSRGMGHIQMKGDVLSLSETMRGMVDCNQTWSKGNSGGAINNVTDCANAAGPVPPKPLTLYNRQGNAITGALSPVLGTFNPTDTTFQGSGALGAWSIRAYCDSNAGSLVIRFARAGNSGGFFLDPSKNRSFDWQNSTQNPLFGGSSSALCAYKFGAFSTSCPAGQYVTAVNPSNGAVTCGTPSVQTAAQAMGNAGALCNAQYAQQDVLFTGTATCPAGTQVVGGMVSCPNGTIANSTMSGNGWMGDCCSWTAGSGVPPPGTVVQAVCLQF